MTNTISSTRTADVATFPNRRSVPRLIGAVLMEQKDEWAAATRRNFSHEPMVKIHCAGRPKMSLPRPPTVRGPEFLRAT